ncbi:cytochrome B6 [Nitrospira sp. M1]
MSQLGLRKTTGFAASVAIATLMMIGAQHSLLAADRNAKTPIDTHSHSNDQFVGKPMFDAPKQLEPLPQKKEVMAQHMNIINKRYDLSGRTHPTVTMSGGRKHIPVGPTAKLKDGVTWEKLSKLSPDEIKDRKIFPYPPLWFPLQKVGGFIFPDHQLQQMEGLERIDAGHDLPQAYLPEFPPPLFLVGRPDLGDVSKGQIISTENFEAIFGDSEVLSPRQKEGLRLLLRKIPAQRHNVTADRSTAKPVQGAACMDCHINGHTSGAFELTPDVRPQSERYRIDTISMRGTFAQDRLGSKRGLRSLEDFTQSEGATAYFDDALAKAAEKGGRIFTREEASHMARFQNIVDFPPAKKLNVEGSLDHAKATKAEIRGEAVFMKNCASCHTAPFYTDNSFHDLRVERFYDHVGSTLEGQPGRAEGLFKTLPLRGIKDSPPYLHDGRLLTLEDTVEFFNLVLQRKMTAQEKQDLVEFLRVL